MQRYNPATALLAVDVQNDFADPDGSLYVKGGERVVPIINGEITSAHANGSPVVLTQDWHPPHTPHFAQDGGVWPVHCVADTWGAELHPELDVEGISIRKGSNGEDGYSGFTMRDPVSGDTVPTELEGYLRARDVRRVVICGLATDYCVKETAHDAIRLGFETAVLIDAIAAVNLEPGDGDRAIEEMRAAGVVLWSTRMR